MPAKVLTSFVISRKKWGRAKGLGGSLRNPITGLMCCLGVYGRACGLPTKSLNHTRMPSDVASPTAKNLYIAAGLRSESGGSTPIARKLAGTNDRQKISETKRESEILDLFASIRTKALPKGVRVSFTD